tara:strand:- start:29 stop:277 length:249 start_codon:yes stop_codon:yes gene_type:complete
MGKVIGMGGQEPPISKINVKLEDLKDIVCENCGGKYFKQVQAFKRLSALISPSGKEEIVPVPTFRCDDCGNINEEFLPKIEK